VEKHPETLLGYRVRRHMLGTDPASDPLIYEQDDESFYTEVKKTKDERYLLIVAESTVSTEVRYADAADPALNFRVFLPRERDHEYHVDHLEGRWIIRSNWQAPNFRLLEAKVGEEGDRANWRELMAHRDDAFILGFDVFKDFLAIEERSGALRKIRIRPWDGGADFFIAADEAAYTTVLGQNAEIDTHIVRYEYSSLTMPNSTYDYDIQTGEKQLLKRDPVLGDFDTANYRTELLWAAARDGAKVPVSLVYRVGFKRDGHAPLLQYGYGSYGYSMDPTFSIARLSLLDRGFVYAIAHVRGGQEMGRRWYDQGRLLNKINSFTDFIDVTRFLVQEGYADPKRVSAMGGSAGGLLMGAVANMAPGDYRAIVAQVPFVDVVTTMLDESIPLTANEFDEWGNPKEKASYDYMLSYSPYDNVAHQDYPAILVTTGFWDSQVQYYEPAKWVARLRARKTGTNPLLFRTTMEAGHGGKSGRFQRFHEIAEEYAFILDQSGITE
jgi:oligopeptidase B